MAQQRVRTDIPAEFIHQRVRSSGHIRNIGPDGLFVGTHEIPEEGETVQIRFMAADGGLALVSGLVWWTSEGEGSQKSPVPGFGIRLVEANETYQMMLARLLG